MLLVLILMPVPGLALVFAYPLGSLLFWLGIAFVAALGLAAVLSRRMQAMGLFEEVLLAEVFLAALAGVAVTNLSPHHGVRFWMAMSLMLAIAALVLGVLRRDRNGTGAGAFLLTQLVHWLATLAAVGVIYLLFRAGRLNHDNAALVMLVVLGLSAFLDGYRISWRFALTGILIGFTALLAALVEQFTWPLTLAGLVVFALATLWAARRRRHSTP